MKPTECEVINNSERIADKKPCSKQNAVRTFHRNVSDLIPLAGYHIEEVGDEQETDREHHIGLCISGTSASENTLRTEMRWQGCTTTATRNGWI